MTKNVSQFNMIIAGVGGQGLITLLQVISHAALSEGYEVRTSELHGLSQRGGSVEVHIRFGRKIYSPMVSAGCADLILGLEMQETLKGDYYASQKTNFLVDQFIQPIPSAKNLTEAEIAASLKKISKNVNPVRNHARACAPEGPDGQAISNGVNIVPADKICREKLQNNVVSGVYLLGCAVFKNILPLRIESVISAIKKTIPEQFLELNLKAFNLAKENLKEFNSFE